MTMIQDKNRGLTLAGYFHAAGTSFLSNLPLNNVPGYYNLVNVAAAVLTPDALLNFDYNSLNINKPMIKEVQSEKNMKVLLSVGGENGNFNFLDGSDKVTNFYNSLREYYTDWGFDGFNFDIRELNNNNVPYIIRAIQWFRESYPQATLSLTAQAADVSPDAGDMTGKWNQLVPVINQLGNSLDWIQIMAYGYGAAFQEIQTYKDSAPVVPPASPPASTPDSTPEPGIPIGDPKAMLEYIFTSFVKPFIFSNPGQESEITGVTGYYGFDSSKLSLGVLPISFLGPEYYVDPDTLKEVIGDLRDKKKESAGGVMISSINDDARNIYDFSNRFTQTTPI
ncbi:MAG: hypothetical protein GY940_12085 [bacterium]|nr:hypothetical protein [bacterium]